MPEIVQNVISVLISLLVWMATYYSGWWLLPGRVVEERVWNEKLDETKRYLLCSCLHSTLHGILVPIGIIASISHCNIWNDFKSNDCSEIELVFAWTVSYFAFDFCLVLKYQADFWKVFVVRDFTNVLSFLSHSFRSTTHRYTILWASCRSS